MGKTYIALENIRHNGKRYEPNDDIELDEKSAKQLLELNAVKVKPVGKESGTPDDGKKADQESGTPDDGKKADQESGTPDDGKKAAQKPAGKGKAKAK